MKKSVILIIATMSLIAIILIGLIFQRAEVYNITIYIQQIVVTDIRIGDDLYSTFYNENQNVYQIENPERPGTQLALMYAPNLTVDIIYQVSPSEASNQSVTFYGDVASTIAQVDPVTGRVTFFDTGTETFTLKANDNSNKTARVRLYATIPNT